MSFFDYQNDPEVQEFVAFYNAFMARLMMVGLYVYMTVGAIMSGTLNGVLGWSALAAIITGGVAWHRWYYGFYPWEEAR